MKNEGVEGFLGETKRAFMIFNLHVSFFGFLFLDDKRRDAE